MARPPLVLSLGEPAGIGPEIVAKAWSALKGEAPFFVLGDAWLLAAQGGPVVEIHDPAEALSACATALPVLHHPAPAPVTAGAPDVRNAGVVADWIERAVNLCLAGEASGLVTAPIAKAPLYAAGFRFPGHTEFIAEIPGMDTAVAPISAKAFTSGSVETSSAAGISAGSVLLPSKMPTPVDVLVMKSVRKSEAASGLAASELW